ncbi:MAG: energy-coupling factor transporter ATPase [Oscillospiraceae bacterium]|nr:energy-coupling factor transporter ATPase [Oscillospiraceae bacterium]
MNQSIIKVKNLCFEYNVYTDIPAEETQSENKQPEPNTVQVLHGVSFEIPKGQFVAILGHNGSGKSTLAKHFNGILTPTSGKVTVAGLDVSMDETLGELRQTVGMVFQNPDNQIVATIVEEDVAFALENLGVPPEQIRIRIDDALETVGMTKFAKHAPHQLSGGQKQRVAIAGVIAMKPKCIILDEPTAMLDPSGRQEVIKTVKKLNSEGATIVYITHYMEEAALADRIIVMDSGKIMMDGTPKEVFAKSEKLREVGLDVPQVTELAHALRKQGLDIPIDIITEDECADWIVGLFSNYNQSV